jgi:indole-3-glycerol phosphate synthase
VKKTVGEKIPILRKDFIFEEYQIYESRAYGADCLLLIVAVLEPSQLAELLSLSHQLGMHCLVEVHSKEELEIAINCGTRIVGINNRDLRTFQVDLNTTLRLKPLIPPGYIVVSESGIKKREDVAGLARCGVNAILVGETLVTAGDTAAKMKELMWSE